MKRFKSFNIAIIEQCQIFISLFISCRVTICTASETERFQFFLINASNDDNAFQRLMTVNTFFIAP